MDTVETEKDNNQRKSKTLHKPPLVLNIFRFIFKYLGALLPGIFGRWSYHLWFQTPRSPTPKREQDWLRSARSEAVIIESDNPGLDGLPVMTYYWENTANQNPTNIKAPLIMLVHGWTGRGSQMGALAEPLLRAGFRVLSFDNHAHANTPGKATSIFSLSAVQQALVKKFGPVYAVVTHSFGGMVTPYSLTHGMQTEKVVCISPPARFDFLLERFSQTLHLPQNIQRYMVKRFKREYGDDLAERVSSTRTSQALGHIPALIIHDVDDEDVPSSESELLHQSWPNSKLILTHGLGHRRILYDPQVIENTVNFLKQPNTSKYFTVAK